jgi:hypothetical protein
MSKTHRHAGAVDRLGRRLLRGHFGISDAAITAWRKNGVPEIHHNTLRLLAERCGYVLPELDA